MDSTSPALASKPASNQPTRRGINFASRQVTDDLDRLPRAGERTAHVGAGLIERRVDKIGVLFHAGSAGYPSSAGQTAFRGWLGFLTPPGGNYN